MTIKTVLDGGNRANGARLERKKTGPNASWRILMSTARWGLVEDCEILKSTDALECTRHGLRFDTVRTRGSGRRLCLLCPSCGRRAFKVYRPIGSHEFACRVCHNLTYTSVQKHDARLDRLLKIPEPELCRLISQKKNITWKLLAIRAGYIRLGLMQKY